MSKTSGFPELSSDGQFVSDINTQLQLINTNEHKNNNIAIFNNVEVNIKKRLQVIYIFLLLLGNVLYR